MCVIIRYTFTCTILRSFYIFHVCRLTFPVQRCRNESWPIKQFCTCNDFLYQLTVKECYLLLEKNSNQWYWPATFTSQSLVQVVLAVLLNIIFLLQILLHCFGLPKFGYECSRILVTKSKTTILSLVNSIK